MTSSTADVSLHILTDRELVERFYAGDGDAFELLYVRYRQRHFRLAMSILADELAAENSVEDAWNQFMDSRNYNPEAGEFRSWIKTVLKRRCYDAAKKKGWRDIVPADDVTIPHAEPNAEIAVLCREFWRAYQDCRDNLRTRDRSVWICLVEGGMKHREVEEALGIPMGAHTKCKNRAQIELEICLRSKGFHNPPENCDGLSEFD